MNFIFDWSGTLADEQTISYVCTRETLVKLGGPSISREEFDAHFCLPAIRFYRRYLPHHSEQEIDAIFFSLYQEKSADIQVFEQVPELLQFLASNSNKPKLYILSSIRSELIESSLKKQQLQHYFEKVCYAPEKSSALTQLLQTENLIAHDSYYIGDLPHDIQSAALAGLPSIGVTYGYSTAKTLQMENPTYLAHSLSELKSILKKALFIDSLEVPISTVGGLIENEKGEYLFIKTNKWSGKWGTPGGKIERGETMESAFAREMLEETGIEVSDIQFQMVQDCIDHPEFYQKKHFILVNFTAKQLSGEVFLNYESQDYTYTTLEKSLGLDLNEPTKKLVLHLLQKAKS